MTAINASEEAYKMIKKEMSRLLADSDRRVTMADALDTLLGIRKSGGGKG